MQRYEDDELLDYVLTRIEQALTLAGIILGVVAALFTTVILGYLTINWSVYFVLPLIIWVSFCMALVLTIIDVSQK